MGLVELDAVGKKVELESEFLSRAAGNVEYQGAVNRIKEANAEYFPLMEARSLFIELVYYGPDILLHAFSFSDLIERWDELELNGELDAEIATMIKQNNEFARSYDSQVDEDIFAGLIEAYLEFMNDDLESKSIANAFASFDTAEDYAADFYAESIFDNIDELNTLLEKGKSKSFAKLVNDPAYNMINDLRENYFNEIAPGYSSAKTVIDDATANYTRGLRELFPNRLFPIDANSTLRLTYGKVEGSAPHDGMTYNPLSTTKGILQKYKPGHPDFDLPKDLVEKLETGDWGCYGTGGENSELIVCFTGSNHTTGGNSGSPAINGNGELVGINF